MVDKNLSIPLNKPLELVGEIAPEVQTLHKRLEPHHPIENIGVYEKSYAKNKKWGLLLGESQISDVQWAQLFARVHVRKRAKREMSIDLPFPE